MEEREKLSQKEREKLNQISTAGNFNEMYC